MAGGPGVRRMGRGSSPQLQGILGDLSRLILSVAFANDSNHGVHQGSLVYLYAPVLGHLISDAERPIDQILVPRS